MKCLEVLTVFDFNSALRLWRLARRRRRLERHETRHFGNQSHGRIRGPKRTINIRMLLSG